MRMIASAVCSSAEIDAAAPACRSRPAPARRSGRNGAVGEVVLADEAADGESVGDGGQRAAAAVAGRARRGAGALWPDLEHAEAIDPGDRSAAVADRGDGHARDVERQVADLLAQAELRLAVDDQCDVGAGAADIEGDDVGMAAPHGRPRPRPSRPTRCRTAPCCTQARLPSSARMTPPLDLVTSGSAVTPRLSQARRSACRDSRAPWDGRSR